MVMIAGGVRQRWAGIAQGQEGCAALVRIGARGSLGWEGIR